MSALQGVLLKLSLSYGRGVSNIAFKVGNSSGGAFQS